MQKMTLFGRICLLATSILSIVPTCIGANWYIALEANGGSNNGTSWANAWTNTTAVVWPSIKPGDTLWLSGGPSGGTNVYTGSLSDLSANPNYGTPTNPITIKVAQDAAHNGLVKIIGGVFVSRDYWVVDGSKSSWIPNSVLDTYNVGTNCNIEVYQTNATSAVLMHGTGSKCRWVHVSQMTSYDDNAFAMLDNGPSHPIGNGSEIAYCWVSEADGYGVRCEIANVVADTWGQIAIHHNLIEGTHDNFLQISGHVDVYKNVGRNQHYPVAGHPDVIQEISAFSRVWDNIFSDNQGTGLYVEANDVLTHDIIAYNNVFYSTTNSLLDIFDITGHDNEQGQNCILSNIWIFNNTVYNIGQGQTPSAFAWNGGTTATSRGLKAVTNLWFVNNCIIGVAPHNTAPMLQFVTNQVAYNGYTGFQYNNNDVRVDFNSITMASGNGNGIVYGNGGAAGMTNYYKTTAAFATAYPQYSHNNNALATFVSVSSQDFRIGAGDTALTGQGTNLATLLSSIAPESTSDVVGTSRGTVWDIGAYQHTSITNSPVIAPNLVGQPNNVTNMVGSTVSFSVTATGTMPLAYQWRLNGNAIAGASLSSLTKGNIQLTDAGNYDVLVSNAAGSVASSVAVLSVTNAPTGGVAPSITGQPQSLTSGVGGTVVFTVTCNGTAPMTYQWRFNGVALTGSSLSSLTKSNLQLTDTGTYDVLVSNASGSILSAGALLTVTNAPPAGPAYYVAINGSDSNTATQARSASTPWRTIQHAVNLAQPGDLILVTPGNYNEYVQTARAGTNGGRITIRGYPANDPNNQVITKQFRVMHQYITIEGFNLAQAVGINNAMIRIESPSQFYNGSDCIITNNTIRDGVMLFSRTASFGTNSIHIRDAYQGTDFNTAGFVAGMGVYLGSDSLFPYTNCGATPTVSSISADGLTMYFKTALAPDAGTNYWVSIVAGADGPTSWRGILTVAPNGSYPAVSNVVVSGNTFSNLIGVGLDLSQGGGTNTITYNKFTRLHGGYAMRIYCANANVGYNTIIDSTNIIWFTSNELIDPSLHPSGGKYYDWQCNLITCGDPTQTNVDFHHNWIQGCDNQLSEFNFTPTGGSFKIRNCVFIGLMAAGNGSMNNLTFDHCTFYRNCYDQYASSTLHLGALPALGQVFMTNLNLSSNVFVDNGSHANLSQEVPYGLVNVTNPFLNNNFSVFGETIGWGPTPPQMGTITNLGDPVFVNAKNPLGPDGLPFTDDDGLRPLPNSPLASMGLGALPPLPTTNPVAHFIVKLANPGWKDASGTNFNPAWFALRPDARGGVMRPWDTPEALGTAPVAVTFDASKSIDGFGLSNASITNYNWQFGDGATASSPQPTISHTFSTAGTNWVTLTIETSSGKFSTYSNPYRTLIGTNTLSRPSPPSGLRIVAAP